jgi:hypothetical protein
MGLYLNGKQLRVYLNGKKLNAYLNGKNIWDGNHEIELTPHYLSWKWDETDTRIITITAGDPPFGASIISGDSDFAIDNYNDSTASIFPKQQNNTASKKIGTLRITDHDGYTIDVSLEQDFTFIWVAVGENKISVSNDLGNTWK